MFRAIFLLSINTMVFSQLNNCLPKRFLCVVFEGLPFSAVLWLPEGDP